MEEEKREEINETGSIELTHNNRKHNIQLLTIIGEIEGHEAVSGNTKATKYEHLLPKLAEVEDNEEIEGLLILLNYRSDSKLSEYGTNSGSYYTLSGRTLSYDSGTY